MLRTPNPTDRRLAALSLFDGLRARDRRHLAQHAEVLTVPAGQVLIHEDQPNRFTYFVLEGRLDVEVDGELVASVGRDELVGERTLLGTRLATATVRTATECELVVLDHRALRASAEDHPAIAERLRGVEAVRLAA